MDTATGIRVGTHTLEEALDVIQKARAEKKRTIDKLTEEGWEEVDPSTEKFTFDAQAKNDAFTTLDFNRRATKAEIFQSMVTKDLIFSILEREKANLKYPHGGQMKVTHQKALQYLAIYIRVQGLQVMPSESNPKVDPQRESFKEASRYFKKKFELDPPSINLLEKLKSNFHISPVEEAQLSRNILEKVISLGQWVCGDEKLYLFWGNSGWIRICPNKPDHIGIWIYELVSKVAHLISSF
jgi:hypothetical protein